MQQLSSASDFFRSLPKVNSLGEITDQGQSQEIPDGWYIVISDIHGSTKAISEGRYKEVNLLGAASIACLKNIFGTFDFPFAFGGDGATMAIPPEGLQKTRESLAKLCLLAKRQFDLDLRIGVVPYGEIKKMGAQVKVVRLSINPSLDICCFLGGGTKVAEKLTKEGKFLMESLEGNPNLDSLSCRWAPIKNLNGTILCLLVEARESAGATQVYASVANRIDLILAGKNCTPGARLNHQLESFFTSYRRETKLRKDLGFGGRVVKIILPMIICRMGLWLPKILLKSFYHYLEQTPINSDAKKLDDTLRLVLDCSKAQVSEIRKFLEDQYDKIYFGLFETDSALMTCLMEGLNDDQHLHFIDGADGGYAIAALELKKQKSRALPS